MQLQARAAAGPSGKSKFSAFFWWEIPERASVIRLHLSVVEWLVQELASRVERDEPRAEIGGLLLGKVERNTGQNPSTQITIQSFAPVHCEHHFGPRYQLSDADKSGLTEKIQRWRRRPDRHLYVVGFVRSHERPELAADAEDAALMREFLDDPEQLLLLVHSAANPPRPAAFFLRDQGTIQLNPRLLFPFDPVRLRAGETLFGVAAQEENAAQTQPLVGAASPATQTAPVPIRRAKEKPDPGPLPDVPFPPPQSNRRVWPWIALSAVLATFLGVAGYQGWWRRPEPPAPVTLPVPVPQPVPEARNLDLHAWVEAGAINVTWNPDAPPVRLASQGILTVLDGTARRRIELDPVVLRTGSVKGLRMRASQVQLNLVGPDREISESVRIAGSVAADPPERSRAGDAAATSSSGAEDNDRRGMDRALNAQPAAPRPVSGRVDGTVQAYFEPVMPKEETALTPRIDASTAPAASSPLIPEPRGAQSAPPVTDGGGSESGTNLTNEAVPIGSDRGAGRFGRSPELGWIPPLVEPAVDSAPLRPDQRVPDLSPSGQPPSASSATAPGGTEKSPAAAAEKSTAPITYARIPPQPLRRSRPTIPRNLADQLQNPIRIRVKVLVDARGRVTKAESLAEGNPLVQYLARAAVDAAREWQFIPSRQGNRNIPGEAVLEFEFKR